MPEYDFAATMREEVEQLRRETGAPDLRPALSEMAQRFQVTEEEALAALWRASKRHGETLSVFIGELRAQFEREAAQAAGVSGAAGAGGAGGAGA
jgi:Flp pilus assembly protein TadB